MESLDTRVEGMVRHLDGITHCDTATRDCLNAQQREEDALRSYCRVNPPYLDARGGFNGWYNSREVKTSKNETIGL